jgi:hypothetical protein
LKNESGGQPFRMTPLATFNSGVIPADLRVVSGNGYVVFDYVNSSNFKFAGIDDAANLWMIGDVVNGTKTNRATFAQTLIPNTNIIRQKYCSKDQRSPS